MNGTGLIRQPSSRLAEGIITHISRSPVDVDRAVVQHAAYADALAASGWKVQHAPPADDCPDSVFIEDAVVVCDDLAVLTHPGAPARRPEVEGAGEAVRALGLRTARIEPPPPIRPSEKPTTTPEPSPSAICSRAPIIIRPEDAMS